MQLSVPTTSNVKSGTTANPSPSAVIVWVPAHLIIFGAVTSDTVNVLVQVLLFNAASFTVIVTVVTPVPTSVPAVGDWVIVNEPDAVQLSVAVTADVKSGTVPWQLPFALPVRFIPHDVMVGAVASVVVPTTIFPVFPEQLPDE